MKTTLYLLSQLSGNQPFVGQLITQFNKITQTHYNVFGDLLKCKLLIILCDDKFINNTQMHLYKDYLLTCIGFSLLWLRIAAWKHRFCCSSISAVEQRFLACTLMHIIVHNIALRTQHTISEEEQWRLIIMKREMAIIFQASAHGTTLSNTPLYSNRMSNGSQNHISRRSEHQKQVRRQKTQRELDVGWKTLAQDQTNLNQRQREGKQIPANSRVSCSCEIEWSPVQHTNIYL
ncbi:Hypothetical_protein [Hexamita inflata]|uniref:Hypothetical_protein n=1 Tax=Hexamita inflata TaxID=28002 RepID=A0AA86NCY7_9EUKA|nr:Hypothetical protein HINF_LOCUS5157 [Hexamita inflata]